MPRGQRHPEAQAIPSRQQGHAICRIEPQPTSARPHAPTEHQRQSLLRELINQGGPQDVARARDLYQQARAAQMSPTTFTLHPITSAASYIVQNVLNVYVCIIDDGRGEGTRAAPSINRREHA